MTDILTTPTFSVPAVSAPALPSLTLSPDEASAASTLAARLFAARPHLELCGHYYDGMQRMQDLGLSIPPQLKGLRTVVGWPAIGVDALVNRAIVEGFRYPGATDVDGDLMGIWQANDLDNESMLAILDAVVYGRAYGVAGTGGQDTAGEPLVTFESPLHMIATFDVRTRQVNAALHLYTDPHVGSQTYGAELAALYLPGKAVHMTRGAGIGSPGAWTVIERDVYTGALAGIVPVVRMVNRQRLASREGASEIRGSWMNTVDSACRTLLGIEVAREFHVAPRKYALGVTEEAFQAPDGTPRSAWDTYLNKVWMLERDENGELPTLGQFPGADPQGYVKILDTYSALMAGEMGVPSHMLGMHPDGNPASADAIRSGYEELTTRARAKQVCLSSALESLMRLALLVRDGRVPPQAYRLETDWRDPAPQTLSGTSDAIAKQIAAGAVPATSDVTLKRLGYSAVERARLADDRTAEQGQSMLAQIAGTLNAKAQAPAADQQGTAGGQAGALAPASDAA